MSKTEVVNGANVATEHKVQQITTRTDSREIPPRMHGAISLAIISTIISL